MANTVKDVQIKPEIEDTMEEHMVEHGVFSCRLCEIGFNSFDDMQQHYRDAHPDIDATQILKETLDENAIEAEYVFMQDDGSLPEGLQLDGNQVIQMTGEDGQIVFHVIMGGGEEVVQAVEQEQQEQEQVGEQQIVSTEAPVIEIKQEPEETPMDGLPLVETAVTVQPSVGKRSPVKAKTSARTRKRKASEGASTSILPTVSSRPKRNIQPNVRSDFVYHGVTATATATDTIDTVQTSTSEATLPEEDVNEATTVTITTATTDESDERPTYTLVQEGGVLTAYQTGKEPAAVAAAAAALAQSQNNVASDDITGSKAEVKLVPVDQHDATAAHNAAEGDEGEHGDADGGDLDEPEYPETYTPTSKAKKGRFQMPSMKDDAMRRFPCPFQGCDYVAKYRSNLWDHKKTHTGEKPYVCTWPSCTMRFSQTHQLKLHLRSHTGERPYICTWPGCNSAFSQKPGLKSHMLTHTGEKPFKCDFPGCGWTFRLKGALTDHKRAIHENAKRHVCEWPGCNKRFLQHCHLKKHIMGHADIKPFSCDWPNCNYKAVTAAYVTNHRKTHTGEKNYECTYPNCNKRFVKSSHVNRHRQRCHPDLYISVGDDAGVEEMDDDEEDEDYGEVETVVVRRVPPIITNHN